MHRHNVFFNLKPDLSDADRDAVIARLRDLSTVPGVQKMVVTRNILAPREGRPHYAWALVGDFKDENDRQTYEKDPAHVDIVRNTFLPNVADFVAVDYNFD